ncbi:MAG: adenylate cyclase, partial [Bacteroidales bacterium]|nr:adenylate cyclase [Bacteroidales bacterium]
MFKNTHRAWLFLLSLLLVVGACKDPYIYDDEEPDWLGSSIYDYLVEKGEYTYFTRIIDTCNYSEVLAKTGSKTMFVCKDSAFEEYFRNNTEGIRRFEDFSKSQLNQIMEYAMVNDASLIETLSYAVGYVKGQVMRRATSLDPFDMLSFE